MRALPASLLLLLGACGDDLADDAVDAQVFDADPFQPDADPTRPDAAVRPDAPPGVCTLGSTDYGNLGTDDALSGVYACWDASNTPEACAVLDAPDSDVVKFVKGLGGGDQLAVRLFPRLGTLWALEPGTYNLADPYEANYRTCGVCLMLEGDVSGSSNTPHFQTGGTVVIDSVTDVGGGAWEIAGSISNVSFVEVTIDPDTSTSTPVVGGCTSHIQSLDFTAHLTNYPG